MKDFNEINYLEDFQKDINFSFLQSIALISAYICGINKESYDLKIFENKGGKIRMQSFKRETALKDKHQPYLLGKSKRFTLERFTAVLDFLLSLYAEHCYENKLHGHSLEYYAIINSLADEGLLKKSVIKRATGPDAGTSNAANGAGDDLTSVYFKCNFDFNFIQDVAKKISFLLEEFLLGSEGKEA